METSASPTPAVDSPDDEILACIMTSDDIDDETKVKIYKLRHPRG